METVRPIGLVASCALAVVVAAGPALRDAGAASTMMSAVLSNGITVVTRERPGSQVLAIDVAVRAGARYEDDETASATRFLESALLLGTERWPTRDALVRAIAARGGELSVPRSEVPPPPRGSFYEFELLGLACHDEVAGELGEVVNLVADGGGWILEVEGPGKNGRRRIALPFVEEFLVRVDREARRIDWRLPEGLIEACASES